ncbi:MAG: transcriptional regulator [Oscillospiraceae bacterium]|jgi:CarD family transcriptional regulator|nr:transcriptional regulator [Oscillospiraceae bacterium]
MQLQVGDAVLYGLEGVCAVAEIRKMKIGGKIGLYYVLQPIFRENATIYVPTTNAELLARMRPVLTKEEIEALLSISTQEELDWIDDPAARKAEFARILTSGDRSTMVRMIRMLYLHRRQLQDAGRHLRTGDDQVLRDAEKIVNDEFALVLGIAQKDVPAYIRARIAQGEET